MSNEENVKVLFEMGKISEPSFLAAKLFCRKSMVGCHNCSVQTRFGWCCDVCLEDELLWLCSQGVHTINSCCGHGNNEMKTIVVIGENSREKMNVLGYELLEERESRVTIWRAKSKTISDENMVSAPTEKGANENDH